MYHYLTQNGITEVILVHTSETHLSARHYSPEAGKQGVYQLDKPIRRRRCLIFDDCRWRTDSLSGTTEAVGAALFHHLIVVPDDSERCASLSHKQRPTVLARDFQDCRPIIGPTVKPGYTVDVAADVYRSIEPVN